MTPENRLGIHGTQTKVNMGPIESIARLETNVHRVFVNLVYKVQMGRWVVERLGQIAHETEPRDVRAILGVERLDEL